MRRLLFFAFSVLASLCSFLTEARADIVRGYLLNSEMRYERSSSQELKNSQPRNFSVGYQSLRWSGLLEYAQSRDNSGSGSTLIESLHEELTAWLRFHALGWTFSQGYQTVQIYGGAGLGGYQNSVTTSLMGESRQDTGKLTLMGGLAIGAEYSLRLNETVLLSAALEGRGLTASDFDPNPLWSAVLRFGIGVFL